MVTATDPIVAASPPPVCPGKRRWLPQAVRPVARRPAVGQQHLAERRRVVGQKDLAEQHRVVAQQNLAEPRQVVGKWPVRRRAAKMRPGKPDPRP